MTIFYKADILQSFNFKHSFKVMLYFKYGDFRAMIYIFLDLYGTANSKIFFTILKYYNI
jgi:hypothetical protein